MKILIISDTHRRDDRFLRVMEQEAPVDMIIHAGDAEGSEDYFEQIAGMPLLYVSGNNDYSSLAPRSLVFPIRHRRVFLTHGHLYQVSRSTRMLQEEARRRHCQIAVFGHTHCPVIEKEEDGLLVLNPGSLAYPRQPGYQPSYIVLTIDDKSESDIDTSLSNGSISADASAAAFGKTAFADFASARYEDGLTAEIRYLK